MISNHERDEGKWSLLYVNSFSWTPTTYIRVAWRKIDNEKMAQWANVLSYLVKCY